MKTKTFFLLLIFISCSWITKASVVHVYLQNNSAPEWHYFCSVDSVIVHKPTNAMTNIQWISPEPVVSYDTIVIVTATTTGEWYFTSSEVPGKFFYIYILTSGPNEPFVPTTLSTCGTLNAQPGAQPGTTYLWSTGATTQSINTSTLVGNFPMEIWVNVSNVCGSYQDTVTITWAGLLPDLGPDMTVCYGTTLDPGTFTAYLWTGGSTQPTLNVSTTGTYAVTVTNSNGCKTRDTVFVQVDTARDMEMCDVTYDTLTNKNSINWYVNPTETEIDSVRIWVKNQFGVFVVLATEPYTQGSYIDWGSNPQADYREYYVTAINNCGEGAPSVMHRSIWLTTLTNELQWQNYVGNFIPLYYIVFARMLNNSIIPIDTVPACGTPGCLNHSAIIPDPNVVKYFVAFEHTCSSNKTNNWVRSNYWDVITDIKEVVTIPFSIYPNPAMNELNIAIGTDEFQVEVLTMLGQVTLREYNVKTLNISNLQKGTYIISIIVDGRRSNRIFTKN